MRVARNRTRAGVAAAATLPLLAGALAMGTPAQADTAHGTSAGSAVRELLKSTKPLWATAKADRGALGSGKQVASRVYLAGKDPKGLEKYATAVSDPKSPDYQHYLTAKQAKDRYGSSQSQIDRVTSWLRSSGMQITDTTQHYIAVRGSAAAVQRAFRTQLHNYTRAGGIFHAPDAPASVPASLRGDVLTVSGLDNAPKRAKHDDTLPAPGKAFVNSGPFSSYYGSRTASDLPAVDGHHVPYAVKGYTGKQLRAAYGATGTGLTGKGVRVAITDAYASPTMAQDAKTYAARNGDQPYAPGQYREVLPKKYTDTKDCDASGWYGEEALDVESVHAVAPDAQITYVGTSSCQDADLLDGLTKVVDNHLADIVSNSWGDLETNETQDVAKAYDRVFELGAVEGIGFNFSTGDDGDNAASSGAKTVGTPANSPWVTAVGGTSLAVGKGDRYRFETGWGTQQAALAKDGKSWELPGKFTSGAGGGVSNIYPQPAYQAGRVPDSLAAGALGKQRVLPDISAVADPNTGFLVGQTQTFPGGKVHYGEYRIGGTSLASPVIAGIQALAQQAGGGRSLGFANPAIYQRAGTGAFHDVTDHPFGANTQLGVARVDFTNQTDDSKGLTKTLRLLGHDSSLNATEGFDDVTGLGSPTGSYLRSFLGR